jgi:ABC-type multidrug transport system ATPase subunit
MWQSHAIERSQPTSNLHSRRQYPRTSCFWADCSICLCLSAAWRDISYSIRVGSGKNIKEKQILKNIHGSAEPGRLIAIMGPTGSGKTSLLNVLAARTLASGTASLSGEILIDGKKRDEETFRRHSAYVQQDDVVYAHQTVSETLQMAADLRLRDASREQSSRLVQSLIQQLGLVRAKDTEIGNSRVRGVSGGERKRTNIGIELTADPGVLFLDEPTSGLDSFQAEAVVRVLSKLCQEGRTIFMSIHQPSSQVYLSIRHCSSPPAQPRLQVPPALPCLQALSIIAHCTAQCSIPCTRVG